MFKGKPLAAAGGESGHGRVWNLGPTPAGQVALVEGIYLESC